MAVKRLILTCGLLVASAAPVWAQAAAPAAGNTGGAPPIPQPPGDFKPDPSASDAASDVWIFSGALQNSHEEFSGTLVAKGGEAQFELKLAGGATCDGSSLSGGIGLVRLNEITCSDDRTMRALFVPQGGKELRVFGHVGDERFVSSAHLLGEEPPPESKQTAQPTAPALRERPGGQGEETTPPAK